MSKLLFRCCEASDGHTFALLTDQPDVEECFDAGYKVAYKDMDGSSNTNLLAKWKKSFTVAGVEFGLVPDTGEVPKVIASAFNTLVDSLLKGVDVFFCDYNLGLAADLPMGNEMMDHYSSTDFVLFSGENLVGKDPRTQPYMVSYAQPRYHSGARIAQQHRIYCKTDHFPFCQAITAIVIQRKRDNLMGGPVRSELTPYIEQAIIEPTAARQALERFAETLQRFNEKSLNEQKINPPDTEAIDEKASTEFIKELAEEYGQTEP